jgi:hypothetical protein
MAPEVVAPVLAVLVRDAARGDAAPLAAVGQALLAPGALPYGWTAAVYAAAAERGLLEVQILLVAPASRGGVDEPDGRDALLDALTLGHRKAAARGQRDPDLLARLAADGDPSVVRELLQNPRLTEPLVVRIAARRPCRPETLRRVFEDRRWRVRASVRAALAKNPFLEPAVALQILPGLDQAALQEIAGDSAMNGAVRALARRLTVIRRAPG